MGSALGVLVLMVAEFEGVAMGAAAAGRTGAGTVGFTPGVVEMAPEVEGVAMGIGAAAGRTGAGTVGFTPGVVEMAPELEGMVDGVDGVAMGAAGCTGAGTVGFTPGVVDCANEKPAVPMARMASEEVMMFEFFTRTFEVAAGNAAGEWSPYLTTELQVKGAENTRLFANAPNSMERFV